MIDISISSEQIALYAFEVAKKQAYPTAIWRLPNQSEIRVAVDFSQKIELKTHNLEETNKGFIFSPFHHNQSTENNEILGYFIKADWYFASQLELQEPSSQASPTEKQFFETIQQELQTQENQNTHLPSYQLSEVNPDTHKELVAKGIEAIKQGEFQKIVLSRRQEVNMEGEWCLSTLFQKLSQMYPNALISVVFIPCVGFWVGASPEILVSVDKQQIFRTMALAGTQAYGIDLDISQAVWTQKEIEEQALVSRYIINSFKKIRLREFEEDGPKTVRAGNLIHLKTDFWVDLKEINFPNLLPTMLGLLHPTSAVCGMPKAESLGFILREEGYDREFYSGFLGQVGIEEETHIFVNLRCMQVLSNQKAYIYAGGGITASSNPEKEWNETVHKMQTLLKAFDNQ